LYGRAFGFKDRALASEIDMLVPVEKMLVSARFGTNNFLGCHPTNLDRTAQILLILLAVLNRVGPCRTTSDEG
jgi:hypothetical protein